MTPQDATEVVPYLTSAAIIVYVQQWLKTRDLYATLEHNFPGAAKWTHRMVAAVGAGGMAIGIHVTFMGDASTGWHFSGTIPDVWTMLHAIGDFGKVYVLQQYMYDSTRKPSLMPHDKKVN